MLFGLGNDEVYPTFILTLQSDEDEEVKCSTSAKKKKKKKEKVFILFLDPELVPSYEI